VPQCAERWAQSLATGGEYEVEFRLKRVDSTYRWHLARALPLRDADGVVVKWFGTNTDMDDLTRTRDQLQKRSEFEQQLIGIVSHDLRNPLNAIFMATSLLLQRGRLDEQHVKIVKRIMSSAERAARLIKDFLDFTQARVEGRIPVALGPANIRDIARQVFEEIHLVYPDRAAELAHSGEETGNWDADRIAQLVGNLVGNAFQHGSAAGTVRVSTHGERDVVTVEVHNDGAPIPPEDLAKLFQPFQRGVQASAPSGRSVGLGLYISREIAVAHGGAIDVRSSADEGTTFTVRLPRYNPA
jgi:signal transduction histidine kinase